MRAFAQLKARRRQRQSERWRLNPKALLASKAGSTDSVTPAPACRNFEHAVRPTRTKS